MKTKNTSVSAGEREGGFVVYEPYVGPLEKGSPIGVLGRVAQQQPLFPWFSIAAAQRDRLSNGPTLSNLASI